MTLDYRIAFDRVPIGLVLSTDRPMHSCNLPLLAMFGALRPEQLDGHSLELLDPIHDEFERAGSPIVASLDQRGFCAEKLAISPRTVDVYRARLMRKHGASSTPELVNMPLS